jgi:hypothetical protein
MSYKKCCRFRFKTVEIQSFKYGSDNEIPKYGLENAGSGPENTKLARKILEDLDPAEKPWIHRSGYAILLYD